MLKRPLQILGFTIITLAIFGLALAFIVIPSSSNHSNAAVLTAKTTIPYQTEAVKPAPASPGVPLRLKIPKINVDASLEQVGLTRGGDLEVPRGHANAAWFNHGPRPGEVGSAVIDGHYGLKVGVPAVFDNLHKLQKGDKLYVEDEKGVIITFVVRESRSYDPEADTTDVFGSSDGKAHLNLITCEGVWDKTQKSYSKRLVVFTDRQ